MNKFRESNNLSNYITGLKQIAYIFVIILMLVNYSTLAQKKESISIEETVDNFLKIWLINHDVDTALTFISDNPAFPKCWADKEEGLEWRKTRAGVVKVVTPTFKWISENVKQVKNLEEIIENRKEKFQYGILKNHKFSSQFDLYAVDKKLKVRIINDNTYSRCEDQDESSSKFLAQRIKKHKELYFASFYFKPSDLVTMLWIKENEKFRLFNLEYHY